jgi:hypothetical protein
VNIACDCPDRSYRATTEDQYRRFFSRAFMPARVHPAPNHRQRLRMVPPYSLWRGFTRG